MSIPESRVLHKLLVDLDVYFVRSQTPPSIPAALQAIESSWDAFVMAKLILFL